MLARGELLSESTGCDPISLKGSAMRLFVSAAAALTLSAASLAVNASVTQADLSGNPAHASAAQRTAVIDAKTRWITVERGDVGRRGANGRQLAWAFHG